MTYEYTTEINLHDETTSPRGEGSIIVSSIKSVQPKYSLPCSQYFESEFYQATASGWTIFTLEVIYATVNTDSKSGVIFIINANNGSLELEAATPRSSLHLVFRL